MASAQSVYNARQKGIGETVNFQLKIELRWHIPREYFEFGLTPNLQRGNLCEILPSLDSNSLLGSELSDWKSKIFPKYLKWPPSGTAGIIPFPLKSMFGKIC